jgi:hypothetical protein
MSVLIALTALFSATLDDLPWPDESIVAGYGSEHCEAINKGGFLLQQANFWSNSAYLAAGLIIMLRKRTFMGTCTGMVFCFLAAGSGYFHGMITVGGRILDIMGIYVVLTMLILYGVLKVFNLDSTGPIVAGCFFAAWMLGIVAGFFKNEVWLFDSDVWTLILGGVLLALGVLGEHKKAGGMVAR